MIVNRKIVDWSWVLDRPDFVLPTTDLEWECRELLDYDIIGDDVICRKDVLMTTEYNGVIYEGIGEFSCGELQLIDSIEIKPLKLCHQN